ncbi:hypothetical protein HYX10_00210 [Candidatus Woesearchaeota archaeon]|nr:hypothetical protein [Candidatus Woesearchaeota archaeon]
MVRDEYRIRELIEQHKRIKEIVEKHPTVSSLSTLFLQKGERDLQVANTNFDAGSKEKDKLLQSAFFNWVVVIAYYSMFHSARGVLAKISVYASEDNVHEAVLNGMYHYYAYQGLMARKLFFMLEDAKEAKDEAIRMIEKLETARTRRGNVNYEVAQAVKETAAKDSLKDAKEFVEAMRALIK